MDAECEMSMISGGPNAPNTKLNVPESDQISTVKQEAEDDKILTPVKFKSSDKTING